MMLTRRQANFVAHVLRCASCDANMLCDDGRLLAADAQIAVQDLLESDARAALTVRGPSIDAAWAAGA